MNAKKITKAVLILGAIAQVLGALTAAAAQLTDAIPALATPAALTTVAVATAIRAVVYTAGDLLDDGKANQSL